MISILGLISIIAVSIIVKIGYSTIKTLYRIHFIDKFKYEESAKERNDIGIQKAINLWFSRGHEKRFNYHFRNHLVNLLQIGSEKDKTESIYRLYNKITRTK